MDEVSCGSNRNCSIDFSGFLLQKSGAGIYFGKSGGKIVKRQWPPKYFKVRDELLLEITGGRFRKGEILGTESSLCLRFHAGRNTIRHALKDLEISGIVERRQKTGIRVLNRGVVHHSAGHFLIPVILPYWNYVAGNHYQQMIWNAFESPSLKKEFYRAEFILSNEPLRKFREPPRAVIAIDPPMEKWSFLERCAENGTRVIAIVPSADLPFAVNLRVDLRKVTRECVELFLKNSRRAIGIVTSFGGNQLYQQWLTGFLEAMTFCDLPVLPDAVCDPRMWKEYGREAVHRFDAMICTNRGTVELVCETAFREGVSIPERISLIGNDEPAGGLIPHFGKRLTVCRGSQEKFVETLASVLKNPELHPAGSAVLSGSHVVEQETVTPSDRA